MCCNALIALPSISGENACISCFLTALPRNRRYGWRAGNGQGHCRGAIRSLRSTQPSFRGQCQYAPPPASVLLLSGGGVRVRDRNSVVWGTSVSVCVGFGGLRQITKNKPNKTKK